MNATNLAEATLVHVAVVKNGTNYQLKMYPQRSGDTTVFHTKHGDPTALEKPREVVWIASGLESGQTIRLESKDPGSGYFGQDQFEITYPDDSVSSGRARVHPNSKVLTWSYSAILVDSNGVVLTQIDPVVIIEDDP